MHKKSLAISILMLTSACAVNPTVRYRIATSSEDITRIEKKYIDSYYLQTNSLTIQYKKPEAPATPAPLVAAAAPAAKPGKGSPPATPAAPPSTPQTSTTAKLVVDNNRLEDTRYRFVLLRDDELWSRTTINLTKIDNTDLISQAGSEVTDNRSTLITNVAGVAKLVLPLLVSGQEPDKSKLCLGFDIGDRPCEWSLPPTDARSGGSQTLLGANGASILTITWSKVPDTAFDTDANKTRITERSFNGLFYASCRKVTVQYWPKQDGPGGEHVDWAGKIADPNWIEYVAFPRKGHIAFHTQCGVSVTSEKDPTATNDAVLLTAITQALAVKDAVDKASKDGSK